MSRGQGRWRGWMVLWLILLGVPPAAAEAPRWSLGLDVMPGLFSQETWDPGWQGGALILAARWEGRPVLMEAGGELGYTLHGWDVLLPLGAGLRPWARGPWSLETMLSVLPGIQLNRPRPFLLLGAELTGRLRCRLTRGLVLSLDLGPRFTWCPGYEAAAGPYRYLDLTAGLALHFAARPRARGTRGVPARAPGTPAPGTDG